MSQGSGHYHRLSRALERALPGLIIASAIFTLAALMLIPRLSGGVLHLSLLIFSTALAFLGFFHLARKWSVFAALEARETSLFAVGATVLFVAPLRGAGGIQAPGDLGSVHMMVWLGVGTFFVGLASALMARKAGFFGPWLIGITLLAAVVWHNGFTASVTYSFRDITYITMSLSFILIGAGLHVYSLHLRRQVAAAMVHRASGDPGRALRIYDAALRINAGDEVLWNNRGNVLADMKRYGEALDSYRRALDINPFYDVARANMKQVRSWSGGQKSKTPETWEEGAVRFLHLWKRKVFYQWSWFFGVLFGLMFLLQANLDISGELVLLGSTVEAYLVLDVVIVMVMVIFTLNRAVRSLIYKGTLARLRGDYRLALRLYAIALRLNPFNDVAWNNRGNVLSSMGRFDEALACYDEALRLFPDQPAAAKNRGILDSGRFRGHFNARAIRASIRRRFAPLSRRN